MLVDTHCHLNFTAFDLDRDNIVNEGRSIDLGRILNPAIDLLSCKEILLLSEKYEEIFVAIGIHPNEARSWDANTISQLTDMVNKNKVVAIGEIGLDYYRDKAPKDIQRNVFEKQLEFAKEVNLPVIIHTRNAGKSEHQATEDALAILKDWCKDLSQTNSDLRCRPGVLHSFSDEYIWAKAFVDLGFLIGINGPVTFKNARIQQELSRKLPIEAILIETDSPFLTPHPHRGQRNKPTNVTYIIECIAHLRGVPFEEVAEKTTLNAGRIFCW